MTREKYLVNPPEKSHEWTEAEFERVSQFLERLSDAKPEYSGPYIPGECYEEGDIVTGGGGYQMIANKPTCDYPFPVPVGDSSWLLPDVPTWTLLQLTDVIYTGIRIHDTTLPYQTQALRVWLQNVTESQQYRVYHVDLKTDVFTAVSGAFNGTVLDAPGWISIKVNPAWILPGDDHGFLLVSQNTSGSTDFNHAYSYTGISNQEVDTGAGNVNRRGDHAQLRVSSTDRDGTDRHAELATVVTGSILRVSSEANLSAYLEYEVTGTIVDNTTWFNYAVTIVDTGAAGEPPEGDVQVYFEVPIATPTDFVELPDHFLNSPSLSGYKRIGDSGTPEFNENGYGIDIVLQQYAISDDYDILSTSDSGGSPDIDRTYDYTKVVDYLDIGDVYEPIATLVTPERSSGTYEVKLTLTWNLSVANKSVYIRWRSNGGAWNEAISEPKDTTDQVMNTYFYPTEFAGGVMTIDLEVRKEDQLGTLDIYFLDVIFQRVK